MHFIRTLSLLACIVICIFSEDAFALPFNQPANIIHLPLKPVQQRRTELHPQVLLQQNINRAHRRFARMTGRKEPSDHELRENLLKRLESLERSEPGISARFISADGGFGFGSQGIHGNRKNKKNGHRGAVSTATVTVTQTAAEVAATDSAGSSTTSSSTASSSDSASTSATDSSASNTATTAAAASASASVTAGASANDTAVTKANTPSGKNSLGLDIEGSDIGYLATIQIGTPPKDFLLLMDSGSADMWVGSEKCKSDKGGNCGKHNFLGTQGSSTFVDSGAGWNITYGTGAVSGTKVTDDISVAGLALQKHKFGVADVESVDFSDNSVPFDGLVGLAQSSISQQKNPTPVESLAINNLIAAAITSYKIPRLADGKNDGEITFGGLDTSKFDPNTLVTLRNVSPQGFWEASIASVSVSGKNLRLNGRTAILDTGTTLIIAPAQDAQAVHNAIPGAKSDGQGGFTVPCQNKASVALTFGQQTFAIDPRDLVIQPVNANDPNGDCVSGIASGNIGGANQWLVGDVFLKNAYFSHDVGANQIQLAKLV